MKHIFRLILVSFILVSCKRDNQPNMYKTFSDDVNFLKKYTQTIVLKNKDEGAIAIVPAYQGRVMTSSLGGDNGTSFGWINRDLIASGKLLSNFNPFGGEDRFWLGPEGGQYSLFHVPGKPFTFGNWVVPKPIDTLPFSIVSQTDSTVTFNADFTVSNYSGAEFKVGIDRTLKVLSTSESAELLGLDDVSHLKLVGYESENRLINKGDSAWNKDNGLISIWILGMFNPSENATIIVPFYQGGEGSLGPVVNDEYFGKIPPDRLHITGGVILFKGDGKYRSKIGLNWKRAKNVLGSYDEDQYVLTVVQYNKPEDELPYVKSMWRKMEHPYNGDVVNAYNDGPTEPGAKPMGPFYEMETSSPVKDLGPGEELVHIHRTFHIQGNEPDLSKVCDKLFGVKLQVVRDSF
jgi:hypothetical protein